MRVALGRRASATVLARVRCPAADGRRDVTVGAGVAIRAGAGVAVGLVPVRCAGTKVSAGLASADAPVHRVLTRVALKTAPTFATVGAERVRARAAVLAHSRFAEVYHLTRTILDSRFEPLAARAGKLTRLLQSSSAVCRLGS